MQSAGLVRLARLPVRLCQTRSYQRPASRGGRSALAKLIGNKVDKFIEKNGIVNSDGTPRHFNIAKLALFNSLVILNSWLGWQQYHKFLAGEETRADELWNENAIDIGFRRTSRGQPPACGGTPFVLFRSAEPDT